MRNKVLSSRDGGISEVFSGRGQLDPQSEVYPDIWIAPGGSPGIINIERGLYA
jgi:hypothetical protein